MKAGVVSARGLYYLCSVKKTEAAVNELRVVTVIPGLHGFCNRKKVRP